MLCIGIDISKARFDGAVCVEGADHNPSFETVQETLARLRYMRNIQPPTP